MVVTTLRQRRNERRENSMKHLYRIVSLNDKYKAQILHWWKLKWVDVSIDYRMKREWAEGDIERVVKTFKTRKIIWRGFR